MLSVLIVHSGRWIRRLLPQLRTRSSNLRSRLPLARPMTLPPSSIGRFDEFDFLFDYLLRSILVPESHVHHRISFGAQSYVWTGLLATNAPRFRPHANMSQVERLICMNIFQSQLMLCVHCTLSVCSVAVAPTFSTESVPCLLLIPYSASAALP